MTDLEFETIQRLSRCRFQPGTWQKRFVRDLSRKPKADELSEPQRECLWRIARSWRRQLGPDFSLRIPFGPGLSQTEMTDAGIPQ